MEEIIIPETIIISEDDMEKFIENCYGEDHVIEGLEGFKHYFVDTETGSYDSEKGAVMDYLMELTGPYGDLYQAWDGYYTGPTGHCFNHHVTFKRIPPAKSFQEALERAGFSRRQVNTILEIYKKYAT